MYDYLSKLGKVSYSYYADMCVCARVCVCTCVCTRVCLHNFGIYPRTLYLTYKTLTYDKKKFY